jgi:hypothetical protein
MQHWRRGVGDTRVKSSFSCLFGFLQNWINLSVPMSFGLDCSLKFWKKTLQKLFVFANCRDCDKVTLKDVCCTLVGWII